MRGMKRAPFVHLLLLLFASFPVLCLKRRKKHAFSLFPYLLSFSLISTQVQRNIIMYCGVKQKERETKGKIQVTKGTRDFSFHPFVLLPHHPSSLLLCSIHASLISIVIEQRIRRGSQHSSTVVSLFY